VLTDPSGLLYLPGVDYTVEDFGDRVELHRVIGGRIGSGQSVLIDYTQDSLPANVIETRRLGSGLRYDFDRGPLDGLGLFVRYSLQRQEIDSPDPGRVPFNEYDDYVYGADYRFLKEFTVGAEHQEHDSTVYPYNADRVYFRWIRNAAETTWSLNGTYTRVELIDDDNVLGLYTISARVDHRFSTRLSGSALVMWRDESNRRYGDNTGFEEQLELRWNYRQVDLYLQARAAQFRGDAQDTNFEFIRMGIRRYF